MKKRLIFITILAMVLNLVFVGCSNDKNAGGDSESDKDLLKIMLIVCGNLGDKSFTDSAQNGMNMIKEKYGEDVVIKTVECGGDQTKYGPALQDASEGDWDVIACITWNMKAHIEEIAPQYPDKRYIIIDSVPNYKEFDLKNVYSVTFKQNEVAFLVGALAARITNSDMPFANPEKKIGYLGGVDNPIINDFLVGYIEGAQYIDPEVKVAISYIGNFSDSGKGKEMALAQYNQGVDIGFNVAGQAGLGQIDAAKEAKKYCLGVDSDQAMIFSETDKEKAELIVTSAMKRVDKALLRAIDLYQEGELKFGESEMLGFNEKCVGIADNEIYKSLVNEEFRTEMKKIEEKIANGEIVVSTAIGMDVEKLNKIRNSAK